MGLDLGSMGLALLSEVRPPPVFECTAGREEYHELGAGNFVHSPDQVVKCRRSQMPTRSPISPRSPHSHRRPEGDDYREARAD